nr:hypothetical protein BaRGS_030875 [Batillaria attramentaria]
MHIYFDSKTQFPVKLYEVANDGYLVKWNADGTSILVDEQDFEDKVMKCYPGFVQIPTFLNFRRLFLGVGLFPNSVLVIGRRFQRQI